MAVESKIGSKGEIFLPKKIREKLGWVSSTPIIIEVVDNELRIRKKTTTLDLIKNTPIKRKLTQTDLEKLDKQITEELEQ